ncbi:protein ABCI7, chloroplastic [Sesamum angolense]|uniref:Protein ABCI7, chloroplastic n=1 Tax=Sesamum angolense TaxID=2727404 RepID=A0AAE2BWU4_9LAMI|nr:protein ABCI7, chloroplastic [Sesamum angolense]
MERVSKYVSSFQGDLFWSLNGVGAPDVIVVYVPEGCKVESPLHFRFFSLNGPDKDSKTLPISNPRVLVLVEKGAEISIVEEYTGGGRNDVCYWTNSVMEIVLGDGAKVSHSYIQEQSFGAAHVKWTSVCQYQRREENFSIFSFSMCSWVLWKESNKSAFQGTSTSHSQSQRLLLSSPFIWTKEAFITKLFLYLFHLADVKCAKGHEFLLCDFGVGRIKTAKCQVWFCSKSLTCFLDLFVFRRYGSYLDSFLLQAALGVNYNSYLHNVHVQQVGPDTVTELSTFHLAIGDQLQDLHSKLVLDHPRGFSRQLHKCIVAHSLGQAVFDGNVQVNREAQQTDAGQLTRSLLLEPRATVNVKPNLQIIADDVKCSHGAAISDLEENQLFYFRARGIDVEAARKALIFSFAAEVVERFPDSAVRKRVESLIRRLLEPSLPAREEE